jgi:hypothetical protein
VSELVKTRHGAVDDPDSRDLNRIRQPSVSTKNSHQVPSASGSQHSAFTKKEENMSSYLTLIGLLLLVMSPLLFPLLISGTHAITDLATTRRVTTFAQRSRAVAVPD